ncbi:transporter [Porphyromonas gulae]|uniref:Transporter n=1 Tax=Porphyromonas gulae TaxID=111105 RepID=A0A0A2EGE6_9PORP|nr:MULTISPECIES: transporter [Porphyromonas]KGL56458.1 transporter [Porphyromonas sp. COT-052 OH4946]KGN76565.1 transporter [Porphyromonas gulae]KGN88152.1 transporter [Porphyromonas gulae]KGO04489.1 transporter [Porphyromonas gulae]
MKKISAYVIGAVLATTLGMQSVHAQGEADAIRYSRTELGGSARFRSMAGAFGALGGDFSAIGQNPAGLGIFRSSELSATIDFSSISNQVSWQGSSESFSKNKLLFTGISYVGSWGKGSEDVSMNFGLGAKRVLDYERSFGMAGGEQKFSVADYTAAQTPGKANPSHFNYNGLESSWLTDLGYNAGWIAQLPGGYGFESIFKYKQNGDYQIFGPSSTAFDLKETGHVWNYDFGMGINIQDTWYLGASMTFSDLQFDTNTFYQENFSFNNGAINDYLKLENSLSTSGSGLNIGIGAIYRPDDAIRIGLSYYTPTWYWLKSYYRAYGASYYSQAVDQNGQPLPENLYFMSDQTPESYNAYQMSAPGRFVASLALVGGKIGLVSMDYELESYGQIKLKDEDGTPYVDNKFISEDFGSRHTIRLGGELRPISRLSLRAGYSQTSNPIKNQKLKDFDGPAQVTIYPMGAMPHYELPGNSYTVSGGLGYRFSRNLSGDLAVIYRNDKSYYYTFGRMVSDDPNPADVLEVESPAPAKLSRSNLKIGMTMSYRF